MEVQEGLEGVVAFASGLSSIVGATLTYRGYVIEDLAEHSTFEEVVYLLWHGQLPSQAELDQLIHDLRSQYALPEPVLDIMHRLPTDVHPMEYVRTVTSVMALYDPDRHDNSHDANVRKATRMVARMPALVAGFDRIRNGKEPLAPKPDVNIATNFLYMLQGQDPDPEFAQFFDTALILHADHEINASTFAARVTVATISDIYSGVVSAIGAPQGPAARRRQRAGDGHPQSHRQHGQRRALPDEGAGQQGSHHGVRPPRLQGRRPGAPKSSGRCRSA